MNKFFIKYFFYIIIIIITISIIIIISNYILQTVYSVYNAYIC